jgi:hypothetical protein
MSIFSTILEKLGIHKPAAAATPPAPAAGAPRPIAGAPGPTSGVPKPAYTTGGPSIGTMPGGIAAQPAPMAMVDVVSKLDNLQGKQSGLDWKVSIVDMLKLLGMDSSLNARKELATELGCPADLMGGDYAKMNVWLHDTVLKKIAENGGNIPATLLKK